MGSPDISVWFPQQNEKSVPLKKNQFFQSDLILGNTDAIGDLTYDFTRKILYAIAPGLSASLTMAESDKMQGQTDVATTSIGLHVSF